MITVTYNLHCDVCGTTFATQQYNIPTGGQAPLPTGLRVFNNVVLCDACCALAVPAMNEALKDRIKVGNA